jgi:hypothetical protein
MVIRKWILALLSAAMIASCAGCGGGSTLNVHNPAGQVSSTVAIAFQPAPPSSILVNATAPLTAVVSNDSSNAGVDWTLLCPNGSNCGSLSPLHTDSGKATTFTPPATISGNSQTFTIEAFAAADHSRNLVTPISVSGFDGILKGTYVFQASGVDSFGAGPYRIAGVVVMDGKGGITSGEQTYANFSQQSQQLQSATDAIAGGSYYIGADGRGTMTINTGDTAIGQTDPNTNLPTGVENLSLVVLSSSQAVIATLDNLVTLGSSGESYQGTLDLQTGKAPPIGGYAFVVNGVDNLSPGSPLPMAFGGVLNIDSPKTISGAGSVADQDDPVYSILVTSTKLSGTVSDPDSFGAVKFDLTVPACSSSPIQLTGYIVDATHIKLIESDTDGSGAGFGSTSGLAIGQGTATGTFKDNTAFSGTFVFGISGVDLGSLLPSSLASAGVFTADGSGNLTNGFNDEYLSLAPLGEISDSFTGPYLVDPHGTGRVHANIRYHTPGNPRAKFFFYLTGNGNPPLILDAADDVIQGLNLAVGTGVAYPQAAPPFSFSGKYGLSFTQFNGSESDGTGPITVDPTAQPPLSGVLDVTFFGSPNPGNQLTGTIDTTPITGRFVGSLSSTDSIPFPTTPGTGVAYYLIDSGHSFFVETDTATTLGVTLGYFATRNPVCQGCP